MKLDHVVYFTEKAPEEVVLEQQRNGNVAVVGGRHEKWGTQNALMYLNNAYIEWLSVEKREIAEQARHPLVDLLFYDLKDGEGWGTLCLSVDHIGKFEEQVKQQGFHTSGILEAQRRTAEGKLRKWKMLFIEQPISDELPYPFFIEWEEAEEARFSLLREEGSLPLANEKTSITNCIIHSKEPQKAAKDWASLLGWTIDRDGSITLPNVVLRFKAHTGEKERLTDVVIARCDE